MEKNIAVLVVCGGTSSEREISLRSGKAVAKALKDGGYTNVEMFDLKGSNVGKIATKKPDVVFLALHGKGGEDGSIQGYLEQVGIPYTGPGIAASAICMDKILTKRFLQSVGLPTPKFVTMSKAYCKANADFGNELMQKIGLPMVLKAPTQGSSIGVKIVNCADEIAEDAEEVFKYGNIMLAEQFVQGTEVTLPIFGNEEPTALPTIEITSENKFYDYEAKYTAGMCHHILPARISADAAQKVSDIGKQTYLALNCKGLSRIDFIIDKTGQPFVIEINTLPGMTEMSLFPDSARYAGISFEELADKIVQLALMEKRR